MNRFFTALPIILLLNLFHISLAAAHHSKSLGSSVMIACEKEVLVTIDRTVVYKLKDKSTLFYRTDMQVDADGSPTAYHPTNDKIADDYKANGYPWGIVRINKKDYIQGENDPAPGFYVSTTYLEDTTKKITDPHRYVNSKETPYIVLPSKVMKKGNVKKGDLAAVINKLNNKLCYAIFADLGPSNKIGEGSIALAKALEINKNPKTGGPKADVIYIVFPGSGNGKVKSLDEINSKGAELFSAFGGTEQINTCFLK